MRVAHGHNKRLNTGSTVSTTELYRLDIRRHNVLTLTFHTTYGNTAISIRRLRERVNQEPGIKRKIELTTRHVETSARERFGIPNNDNIAVARHMNRGDVTLAIPVRANTFHCRNDVSRLNRSHTRDVRMSVQTMHGRVFAVNRLQDDVSPGERGASHAQHAVVHFNRNRRALAISECLDYSTELRRRHDNVAILMAIRRRVGSGNSQTRHAKTIRSLNAHTTLIERHVYTAQQRPPIVVNRSAQRNLFQRGGERLTIKRVRTDWRESLAVP